MKLLVCFLICCLTAAWMDDAMDVLANANGPEAMGLPNLEPEPMLHRHDRQLAPDVYDTEEPRLPKMQWFYNRVENANDGKECVHFAVHADDPDWWDNYLCFDHYYGVHFNDNSAIPDLECILINEPDDKYSWENNYLCQPKKENWRFQWSHKGRIPGMHCVKINDIGEPHAPVSWEDNYLCIEGMAPIPVTIEALRMRWFVKDEHARGQGHCIEVDEPEDPAGWWDNWICFNGDYGVKFSYNGTIDSMDCIKIEEPNDKHNGWDNNFLCFPKMNPWRFTWHHNGKPAGNNECLLMNETDSNKEGEPSHWDNNFLCLEGVY